MVDAPEDLFERHGRAIKRYLHRLTGSEEVASDLTQEVFLRLVRSAPAHEGPTLERAWLFRVARNLFIDHMRRSARMLGDPLRDLPQAPVQGLRFDLQQALDSLPAADRDVFLLCEVGGFSYDEIARITESTRPAVRSRVYRARQALRAQLGPNRIRQT